MGVVFRLVNPDNYTVEKALERKKLRERIHGFKGKNLDVALRETERSDIVCPITGDNDLLDTAESIYVCDKCFRKFASYDGVKAIPIFPMGIGGEDKCALCGRNLVRDTLRGVNSWYVIQMPISLKAMWHKLGQKRRPLKVFGDVIFY